MFCIPLIFYKSKPIDVFNGFTDEKFPHHRHFGQLPHKPGMLINGDFRKKHPAEHRTKDGHYVRSKAETIIDDSLYLYGIPHAYERKLPNTEEHVYSDFHIPAGNGRSKGIYIEYWGMENDDRYNERKHKKIEIYQRLGLILIELSDGDVKNIDDILPRYLLKHGIKVS